MKFTYQSFKFYLLPSYKNYYLKKFINILFFLSFDCNNMVISRRYAIKNRSITLIPQDKIILLEKN